jgi:hypothetical protein
MALRYLDNRVAHDLCDFVSVMLTLEWAPSVETAPVLGKLVFEFFQLVSQEPKLKVISEFGADRASPQLQRLLNA